MRLLLNIVYIYLSVLKYDSVHLSSVFKLQLQTAFWILYKNENPVPSTWERCFLSKGKYAIGFHTQKMGRNMGAELIEQIYSLTKHPFCCSVVKSCLSLCDPMIFSTPGFLSLTISQSLPKFMSIELVMPSSHLILCRPLLLLLSILPSIRVFSNQSAV